MLLSLAHTRTWGTRVIHSESKSWQIPYCHNCREHGVAYEDARNAGCITIVVPIVGLVASTLVVALAGAETASLVVGFLVGLVLLVICIRRGVRLRAIAGELLTPQCTSSGFAAEFVGWDGSIQSFRFSNPLFLEATKSLNADKCLDW